MSKSDDVFLKQMKGVSPINKKNRIEKTKPKKNKLKINFFEKTNIKKNLQDDPVLLKKTIKPDLGLQNINIKKSIKRGLFKIDKKIDFHGHTLTESEKIFSDTLVSCYKQGLRCVLFITGKGLHKTKDAYHNQIKHPKLYHGVIREAFVGWAKSEKHSKHILSYTTARLEHGGDGAFYVYLRKKKN